MVCWVFGKLVLRVWVLTDCGPWEDFGVFWVLAKNQDDVRGGIGYGAGFQPLGFGVGLCPGALPQAGMGRAVGAAAVQGGLGCGCDGLRVAWGAGVGGVRVRET